MRTSVIVGGGYAGFYPARRLEKKLRRGAARVILVSPASVQHPREAFLAGAGPRVPAPAEAAGARAEVVIAGDALRS